MGIIVTVWGVVMMCTGFVHNFAGLCVARIFLGLFEYVYLPPSLLVHKLRSWSPTNHFPDRAGFFPGAILIISKWYLPGESQTRIAIFFTASAMAGAFSGLLAFGIVRMDGVAGYEGWRWVRQFSKALQCSADLC